MLLLLAGCDGSSAPEPPTPITVSFANTDFGNVEEHHPRTFNLLVNLSEPVDRVVTVGIVASGEAQLGLDYEISSQNLRFEPRQTQHQLELEIIDDWHEEDEETVVLTLSRFSEAVTAGSVPSLSFPIMDLEGIFVRDPTQDFFVAADLQYSQEIIVSISVYNFGNKISEEAKLRTYVFNNVEGFSGLSTASVHNSYTVPPIAAGNLVRFREYVDPRDYIAGNSYMIFIDLDEWEQEGPNASLNNWDYTGFSLDRDGQVRMTCSPASRNPVVDEGDPLLSEQWNLNNTGQRAYAQEGGNRGEDLGMRALLESNRVTGEGVKVAVVDTGLEICHPDLQDNVELGGSYNFPADLLHGNWLNADRHDPYLPAPTGDHGTSVAGVIGAVMNNRIGLRGIAPSATLVGYNYLTARCCREESLGASTRNPDSASVDVFNMSLGTLPYQGIRDDDLFANGTSNLRGGRGAIFVKAAGNAFRRPCLIDHVVNTDIGCASSSGDPTNNSPYLIVVGAVNAHGVKASYSSVGSNLWISAPAGQYGSAAPATITADQLGRDRGYSSTREIGVAVDDDLNPFNDYMSTFNGTSSATPHVSGVVALLLEAEPELTWRDVKHILATTARETTFEPDTTVRIGIGSSIATLQNHWITNAAGYSFHNWFGFGVADVDAALTLIELGYQANSLGEFQQTNWIQYEDVTEIPDENGIGIVQTLNVDLGSAVNIEAVQLQIKADHPDPAQLGIELTSPSGTTSILSPVFNNALATATNLDWVLLSNAFYGENPNGQWRLRVIDVLEGDTGTTGLWGLKFWYGDHP